MLPQSEFLKVLQNSTELAVSLLRTLAGRPYETDRCLSRYAPDPVTGVAGRRAFHDQSRRLAAVARRRKTGALLLVLDVSQLKAINDRYGYGVGDDVLRVVGDALVEGTRTTDLIVRHGGDEFVVFFPDAGPGDADTVIARVREKIKGLSMTVSASDRKSTRLNSSHVRISYAVFCLKKKKINADTATALAFTSGTGNPSSTCAPN